MKKLVAKEVSIAIAEAVGQCNVDVISAYPITPQTHIVEHLAEMVNNGEIDAEYIPVESEHAALSVCIGASLTGARTFTATASQGLLLMYENMFIASGLRAPVLMVLANRSISAPLSIWNDHSDVATLKDTGWIQVFVENGQEAVDLIYQGYKIAEKCMLPFLINIDGFTLTHVIEGVTFLEKEKLEKFLPPYRPKYKLDPRKPISIGVVGVPEVYTEAKKSLDEAHKASYKTVVKVFKEFEKLTGRKYSSVEAYRTEDAEVILIIQGSFAGTARYAVDELRKKGKKVGLLRFRLWRPFPLRDFCRAIGKAKVLVVVDRAVSHGSPGGPVGLDVRAALYQTGKRPKVVNFVGGLSSRDISREDFKEMIDTGYSYMSKKPDFTYLIYGAKE